MSAPELLNALPMSRMRMHQLLAEMCERGEVERIGTRVSRGGRPAYLYSYVASYAHAVLIDIMREERFYRVHLQLLNMAGTLVEETRCLFAQLDAHSFDQWLDEWSARGLDAICFHTRAHQLASEMLAALSSRYQCRTQTLSEAALLLPEEEGAMCVLWRRDEVPQVCLRREGHAFHTGDLSLLPLPVSWTELDYEDRALVEEMIARLLLYLVAILSPSQIRLYTDCLSERLRRRISYNFTCKLAPVTAPSLEFWLIDDVHLKRLLCQASCSLVSGSGA